jgi:hypothetical protein
MVALPNHNFIDKYSQAVPIHCLAIALARQDFRSNVLWGATQSICPITNFKMPDRIKILKLEVAIIVDQNVFWLQVSVYELLVVHVIKD